LETEYTLAMGRPRAVIPRLGPPGRNPRVALALRTPPHPGRFLETRFLKPLGISQSTLAEALGVSRRRVNELIRGHRGITPDTAVRLALYFDNDATFWMHLQTACDLLAAMRRLAPRRRTR
jgi:addiction module HigA family antidote